MTSLLARLGHLESRRAAQTVWSTGKRKRPAWTCAECNAWNERKQLRGYHDDAIRLDGIGRPLLGHYNEMEESRTGWQRASNRHNDNGNDEGPVTADKSNRQERIRFRDTNASPQLLESQNLSGTPTRLPGLEYAYQTQQTRTTPGTTASTSVLGAIDGIEDSAQDESSPFADNAMLDINYQDDLTIALLEGEADLVVRCLHAAKQANDIEWLHAIPSTTFSEIIRILEPNNFIKDIATVHVELSTAMVAQLGLAPMREVAYEYSTVLHQIVSIRRAAGARLTLGDYTVLLRSARDLGNRRLGASIFDSLLQEGHTPTTACYNYYMAAVVWNGVHLAGSRQKVRVVPYNMHGRKQATPGSRFRNYRVGVEGVREVATSIFNNMLAHGAIANEESFRNLLTAAAREGDVSVVKSLLNKVWGVDVDAIMEGQDEASVAPAPLPEHSPLRPTSALLFTIAHAFGINNDIPTALRIVDFVARHFKLTMTSEVWRQLFEWTFVLSIPRWGRNKADGSMAGQLPPESLLSLWETMTGAPYHIKPSMGMYNYLIKNLFRRKWTPKLLEKMEEGIDLYTSSRFAAEEHKKRLRKKLERGVPGQEKTSIEQLRHAWDLADLARSRHRSWVNRWIRLLLGSCRDWNSRNTSQTFFSQKLPPLLWRWRSLAPTTIQYETPTGFVEFDLRSDEEMVLNAEARMAIQQKTQNLLEASQRYVGDRWTRAREPSLPLRLQDEAA